MKSVRFTTNSVTEQHPLQNTLGACSSASAVPLRPRLATTHSVLIFHNFRFLFSVWWWRARSGFSKGETDGILVPIRWTRFCRTIFWGFGFGKTETDFVFVFCPPAERGLGNECGRVFLWDGDSEKQNFFIVPLPFSCLSSYDYGVHPRHPPRTFPLGLLAPRCLGLALLLAIARLRAGGSGAMLFGGRKESSPQLRSPPRSRLLEYSVLYFG